MTAGDWLKKSMWSCDWRKRENELVEIVGTVHVGKEACTRRLPFA